MPFFYVYYTVCDANCQAKPLRGGFFAFLRGRNLLYYKRNGFAMVKYTSSDTLQAG